MRKHTPGPWSIVGDGDLQQLVIQVTKHRDSLPTDIACIQFDESDPDAPSAREKSANARLIAAAPELLEALCMLVRCTVTVPGTHGLAIDNALAVIAKATGEQS